MFLTNEQLEAHHIVLFGGGLDSTGVLLHLIHNVKIDPDRITLFHVNYGQKAVFQEQQAAQYFAVKYGTRVYSGTLDLGFSKATIMHGTAIGVEAETNRLELRNLALLGYASSYAASKYEDSILHVGFHVEPTGSGFPDAKTHYLQVLSTAIAKATDRTVQILAPLHSMTRLEILDMAYAIDPEVETHSYTCYESTQCGKCMHCQTKQQMFNEIKGAKK